MKRLLFVVCVIFSVAGGTAWGWWSGGHSIMTKAAVRALPDEVPAFFRAGEGMIAHCSYDPDISKNRGAPHVSNAEHPEHYLDLELLEGKPFPKNRYEFTQLCTELGIKPDKVGFVPYAVAEWTERLAVAFAEHRKWPNNTFIQNKCLVHCQVNANSPARSGLTNLLHRYLAHYAIVQVYGLDMSIQAQR